MRAARGLGTTAGAVLAAVALLVLTSCGSAGGPSARDLDGRTFLSTAVTRDGPPHELVRDTRVRVSFADGQVSANAGCNTASGRYRVDAGTLELEDGLAVTEMGCEEELQAQDEWLWELLSAAPAVALDEDRLSLRTESTVLELLDRVVADPDRPLVGEPWTVDSLVSGDAVSTTPGDATASLQFGDDVVQVDTGCNRGRAGYERDGDRLTLGPLALTRMACPGDADELERAVVAVLESSPLTLEIEAARMTLTSADGTRGLGLRQE